MKFNINDNVRVKLTPLGKKIHRERHDEFCSNFGINADYNPPKEDSEGWSTWQFWVLVNTFGEHVGIAMHCPFETEIEIIEDKLRERTYTSFATR